MVMIRCSDREEDTAPAVIPYTPLLAQFASVKVG